MKRSEKQDRLLKKLGADFHIRSFPEDGTTFFRPPDVVLHTFLLKFLDDYSWREDMPQNHIRLHIFERDEFSPETPKPAINEQEQYDLLRWLRLNKYLTFSNADGDGFVDIHDVDDLALENILDGLSPEIKPAKVTYVPSDRVVIYNGLRHKMRGRNLKIFDLLARNPNDRISKEKIWRTAGIRAVSKRDYAAFSKMINDVRITLKASGDEIKLDGSVTLHAYVEIID